MPAAACTQRPRKAYPSELAQFHSPDYVEFLSRVTPENQAAHASCLGKFNINEDCPVFDGMFGCACVGARASECAQRRPAAC